MALGPLEYQLLLDILAAFLLESGLPNTAQFACRCGDSRFDLRRKILNILVADAALPNTAQFSWRPGDSEFIVLRKWLIALGGECRCNDSVFSLYQRILTQVRLNSGLPNTPEFEFRAGDSLLDILRKILNNLQNATPPEPPECCVPIGDYDFITNPVTEQCDWGLVSEGITCNDDWGALV